MFHLAQLNIGRILAPMDSPTMAGFAARLDDINALADGHAGFVWRLQDDAGNATALRPFEDEWLLVNMSVWESVEQLKTFTYNTAHAEVMRQRRQWFEPHTDMYFVMWWIPEGHIPTLEEAKARLKHIQTHGESEHAFTFRNVFPHPSTQTMDYRNRDAIWQLVCEYTESEQLRKHMLAVEAAMIFYARKYGEDEVLWGNIGLIHDFDYDRYPDQHPFYGLQVLTDLGFPETFLYTLRSHADYGDPNAPQASQREPAPRIQLVDKVLYAVDELTGLVMAVAYVRPSKLLADVDLQAVKKKWKDKAFARGAKREDIVRGAEELGVPLDEHIQNVLTALQSTHERLGV